MNGLGERHGIADLHGHFLRGPMQHGLAVKADDIDVLARDAVLRGKGCDRFRMRDGDGALSLAQDARPRTLLEPFVLVLAPYAPHLAEELWQALGHSESLAYTPWPTFDPTLLKDDEVEVPVQVNGKRRDEITVAKGLDPKAVEAMAFKLNSVHRALDGRPVKKVIVVPGRIINIVG
jgi:hypothetical protein